MLKHEDNQETSAQTAAQARVTPQELAAALARLEARQGDGEGTIPLGDAVQELGLSATPEDLLREIEAGRARSQEGQTRTRKLRSNQGMVGGVLFLILSLCGGVVAVLHTSNHTAPAAVAPVVAAALPAPQAPPMSITVDPNLMVQDASGKLVMLSEVGENQPVQCGYNGETLNFQQPDSGTFCWTLIKHDGKVYVRGKIVHMSPKVMQADGAVIAPDPVSPPYVVRVTLPLDGFKVDDGSRDEFHAIDIHLDKHAYEKWEP